MKWNARVFTNVTFDFEIEADTENEVKARIEKYLGYVSGGKPEGQSLSVKTKADDELTGIFVQEAEIEDVYELDTV